MKDSEKNSLYFHLSHYGKDIIPSLYVQVFLFLLVSGLLSFRAR